MTTEQYRQLARYNTWMNQKLYADPGVTDFMVFLWDRMDQQAQA